MMQVIDGCPKIRGPVGYDTAGVAFRSRPNASDMSERLYVGCQSKGYRAVVTTVRQRASYARECICLPYISEMVRKLGPVIYG